MKKKLIIIITSIIAVAGLAIASALLIPSLIKGQDPISSMSDSEFLTHFETWHGNGSDKLVWTFKTGGKGTITTNGGIDTYDMTWRLSGNTLTIITAWLYDQTDSFSFTTDREAQTFTIVDTAEDKITTFTHNDLP